MHTGHAVLAAVRLRVVRRLGRLGRLGRLIALLLAVTRRGGEGTLAPLAPLAPLGRLGIGSAQRGGCCRQVARRDDGVELAEVVEPRAFLRAAG